MSSGSRYESVLLVFLMIMTGLYMLVEVPFSVSAAPPVITGVNYSPEEPTEDDDINLSATFDVTDTPLEKVEAQYCIDQMCYQWEELSDDGSGETFYKTYTAGTFPSGSFVEIHVKGTYDTGETDALEVNFTIMEAPEGIVLNAVPDRTTLFPNNTVKVNGTVTYDIGGPVEGAQMNLSVPDLSVFDLGMTDNVGNFSLELEIEQSGFFEMNLSAVKGTFEEYREWMITVDPWPLPNIVVDGDVDFQTIDTPPQGPPDTYYTGSPVNLSYGITNSGTGDAYNVTVNITIDNSTSGEIIVAGDLAPDPVGGYEGLFHVDTETAGNYTIRISVHWDQMAPKGPGWEPVVWQYHYTVVPRPVWSGHNVLLEMYTQTTCAPCVAVEEAMERLYHQGGYGFEFITYIFEDPHSTPRALDMGVEATPMLFFDNDTEQVIEGGGALSVLEDTIVSMVENASRRETPPVDVRVEDMGDGSIGVSAYLPVTYQETFSGRLDVYNVEMGSDLRNHQGIPIAHRFKGSVYGEDVEAMAGGHYVNHTLPYPDKGMGYVIAVKDEDSHVVQSMSFFPREAPEVFMKGGQTPVLEIDTPGTDSFNLTLQRFSFEDEILEDTDVTFRTSGLTEGWTVTIGTEEIDADGTEYLFDTDQAEGSTLPVGRMLYESRIMVQVALPANTSGSFDFDMVMEHGPYNFSRTVVVLAETSGNGGDIEVPAILDHYLEAEGRKIYYYVEAENVPDDASVKGRIQPCDYESESQLCGAPLNVVLAKRSDGRYRAALNDIDLETFSHLSFRSWIELANGTSIGMTEEDAERISDLIDVGSDDDDEGDDGGDGEEDDSSTLIIILSVGGLLVLFALVAVFLALSKRSGKEGEEVELPAVRPEGQGPETGKVEGGTVEGEKAEEQQPSAAPSEQPPGEAAVGGAAGKVAGENETAQQPLQKTGAEVPDTGAQPPTPPQPQTVIQSQQQPQTPSEPVTQPQTTEAGPQPPQQSPPPQQQMTGPSEETREIPPVQERDPGQGPRPPQMQGAPEGIHPSEFAKGPDGQEPPVPPSEGEGLEVKKNDTALPPPPP